MDLDAMHRQVQGLMKFRTEVENLIKNGVADVAAETGPESLSGRLGALEDTVTGVQKALDELGPKLADLPALLEGVSALQDLADNKDRLLAAAEWIDQNKEQVAALVQIGDDLADPAAETATGTAGEATGAAAATGGTNTAPDSAATPSA